MAAIRRFGDAPLKVLRFMLVETSVRRKLENIINLAHRLNIAITIIREKLRLDTPEALLLLATIVKATTEDAMHLAGFTCQSPGPRSKVSTRRLPLRDHRARSSFKYKRNV